MGSDDYNFDQKKQPVQKATVVRDTPPAQGSHGYPRKKLECGCLGGRGVELARLGVGGCRSRRHWADS